MCNTVLFSIFLAVLVLASCTPAPVAPTDTPIPPTLTLAPTSTPNSEPTALSTETPEPTPIPTETPEPTTTPLPGVAELIKENCPGAVWRSGIQTADGERLPTGVEGERLTYELKDRYFFESAVFCASSAEMKNQLTGVISINMFAFDKSGGIHNFKFDVGAGNGYVSVGTPVESGVMYTSMTANDAIDYINQRIGEGHAQMQVDFVTHGSGVDEELAESMMQALYSGEDFPETDQRQVIGRPRFTS